MDFDQQPWKRIGLTEYGFGKAEITLNEPPRGV